jgi:hypothetical protein
MSCHKEKANLHHEITVCDRVHPQSAIMNDRRMQLAFAIEQSVERGQRRTTGLAITGT